MNLRNCALASESRYSSTSIADADWVEPDYFDLEDIMASSSSVSCVVMPQMDRGVFPYLQQPPSGLIPPRGVKSAAQLWLFKNLQNAQILPPQDYNPAMEQALKAGAYMLNFETEKRFFYEFGLNVGPHLPPVRRLATINMLVHAYTQRQREIFKTSIASDAKPHKLSELEKRLFKKGYHTEKRFRAWWIGESNSFKH